MIKVTGTATLNVPFTVSLNMTEDQFDNLHPRKQQEILDYAIDWQSACRNGETDDIEVDIVEETLAPEDQNDLG